MDRFDKSGFESAAGYFQQALAIDSNLIRAAEWLAAAHEFSAEWGFVPAHEGYEQARTSVDYALKLGPRSGLAHSLMCTIHLVHDWDWAAAAEECNRALALEPRNPQVLGYVGQYHTVVGQWDEAARLITASIALDPLFAGWHDELAIIRDHTGRLAEAEAERRKTLEISPTYERGHLDLGLTLLAEGKLEAALDAMRQETVDGGRDAGLSIVYYAMGRKAEADQALARFTKDHANDRAYRIAQIHAYPGDGDKAFRQSLSTERCRSLVLYRQPPIQGTRDRSALQGLPAEDEFFAVAGDTSFTIIDLPEADPHDRRFRSTPTERGNQMSPSAWSPPEERGT
jgi:tetratricopeptide (TPR) repeat protein